MVLRRSTTHHWNLNLLDFIIQSISVPQEAYIPKNPDNPNDIMIAQETLSIQELPNHFIDCLHKAQLAEEIIDNLYIFKVNTTNSLLHSILGLFDTSYRVSPWERKQHLVELFKSKLYWDSDNCVKTQQKISKLKLSKTQIMAAIQIEFPSQRQLQFICSYFDINICIVTRDKIEWVPTQIGQAMPTIMLYQYPFGNLAPIIQGDQEEQILIWSKSPLLQALINQQNNFSKTGTTTISIATDTDELSSLIQKEIVPKTPSKVKELLRLNLLELQSLCTKYDIAIKVPSSKPGHWKNKTKSDLADALSTKYAFEQTTF